MQFMSGHNGETTSTRSIAGFHFTEIIYSPNASFPRHFHTHSCFCFVRQGGYTEVFRSRVIECNASDLVFRPAGEVHADHFGKDLTRCFVIEFESEWLRRLDNPLAERVEPASIKSATLAITAERLLQETRQADAFSPLAVEGLMLELLAGVARRSGAAAGSRVPRWLKTAREMLHDDISSGVTLGRIANAVGVHPVYLATMFRRHYHCSVGEYVRRLRIEFACRQLAMSDSPLVEIALAAGFAHQPHFSRTFKRLTGLTPGEYRLKHSS